MEADKSMVTKESKDYTIDELSVQEAIDLLQSEGEKMSKKYDVDLQDVTIKVDYWEESNQFHLEVEIPEPESEIKEKEEQMKRMEQERIETSRIILENNGYKVIKED